MVAATFIDRGRTLETVSRDGYVDRWDADSWTRRGKRDRPVDAASGASFSADGRTIAFAWDKVWVWERGRGDALEVAAGPDDFPGATLSPDGLTLAGSSKDGVRLWDVRSRSPLGQPFPKSGSAFVAFRPDSRALASAALVGNEVWLWDGVLWTSLADLRKQVCSLVIGDLTKAEWSAIAPGIAYRRNCGT